MADDGGPVPVPRQVHCELETLRQIGTHDLRSAAVFDALEAYDFEATRAWIVDNPERYKRAISRGTRDQTLREGVADESRRPG